MSGLQSNTTGMRCLLQLGEDHDLDMIMFCSLSYCIIILYIEKNVCVPEFFMYY